MTQLFDNTVHPSHFRSSVTVHHTIKRTEALTYHALEDGGRREFFVNHRPKLGRHAARELNRRGEDSCPKILRVTNTIRNDSAVLNNTTASSNDSSGSMSSKKFTATVVPRLTSMRHAKPKLEDDRTSMGTITYHYSSSCQFRTPRSSSSQLATR